MENYFGDRIWKYTKLINKEEYKQILIGKKKFLGDKVLYF